MVGFAAGDTASVIAVGEDGSVARVDVETGQVHPTTIRLDADQLKLLDDQSIASDGRVAFLNSPRDGVSDLLLWPGDGDVSERVALGGVKQVPRWTKDEKSVVFLSDQAVAASLPVKLACSTH